MNWHEFWQIMFELVVSTLLWYWAYTSGGVWSLFLIVVASIITLLTLRDVYRLLGRRGSSCQR